MLNAVIAVFGFNDDFHIFVNLFLLAVAADGLNQIAALQDFVQHAFAEYFVPAARAAGGNTADDHIFAHGRFRAFFQQPLHFGGHIAFALFSRRGGSVHPFDKSRIIGGIVAKDIGAFPVNGDARGNQVGEQVVKLHNAAFFGVVGSQHFNIFFIRQRAGGQRGKHAFGTAFHKQAHAGIVGGFELFNPFHRVGNLRDHEVFDFLGVIGIKFRRDVGGNGQFGRVKSQRIQKRAVLRHGRTHDFGMESMRNGDLHGLNAHIGKHFNGIVHGFGSAGNDGLGGAVFIGYGHIPADAFEVRLHGFGGSGDGSHFAVVFHFNFGHYLAAGADGFEAVFKIKNTGGHGGGVFAQTVPHDYVRLKTERGQQAHHGHVGGQHGGLGHFGFLDRGFPSGQLFFGLTGFAPQCIGQVLADDFNQVLVGFHEGIHNHFILGSQIFHHVHILRALAREHKANLGFVFAGRKRINAFHFQIQRFLRPYVLPAGNLDEIFNFFFQFFRIFHVNGNGEFAGFLNMVFIRNAGQIGRVIFNGQNGFAQFIE